MATTRIMFLTETEARPSLVTCNQQAYAIITKIILALFVHHNVSMYYF